ncbi:unnamed protein product [Symbiodinium natans]|uniref:Uncharacterized protein n=1 Tax=Symbiodinium natans TaxID=878477 RepID=A0A812G2R0_9DINO|nr:unnamed protein product [Symbiodinium natans]
MLYCNFPVDAGNLQSYLSPKLKPELFEGKAWVTAMIFNVESLKLETIFGKVAIGGGSELLKLTTNVVRADNGDKGYLLMNLDFPSGAQGWVQKLTSKIGCSATQPGVKCGSTTAVLAKSGSAHLEESDESYDGVTYDVAFEVINRPYKVLQDGPQGVVRVAHQEGKDAPSNYRGYKGFVGSCGNVWLVTVNVESLFSSVFAKRWPDLKVDESFASAHCFWADQLVFVDHDGDKI